MIDSAESSLYSRRSWWEFPAIGTGEFIQGTGTGDLLVAQGRTQPVKYPLLDKVIHHYAGRLLLVNIDANALKIIETLPSGIRDNSEIVKFHDLLTFYAAIYPAHNVQTLEAGLEANPDDQIIRQQLAAHYVIGKQYKAALEQVAAIMDRDEYFADSYAQQAMLRVFNIIGGDHPLASKYRSNLKRYTH